MSRAKRSTAAQLPQGAYDIVLEDQKYWHFVFKKVQPLLEDYSFERTETSLLEPAELYLTLEVPGDVMKREFLSAKIKDGHVVVRPSLRISLARAYAEHGMHALPHPLKLYGSGQVFRFDADGHIGQCHELTVQTIGDDSEVTDAELLFLAHRVLETLGLHHYNVHINTLGDQNCRPGYLRALRDFYKNRLKKVCAKCRLNFKEDVLLLLSCAEAECREALHDAPQLIDFLDEGCKNHFKRVLEFLDLAKIPYILDPYLIREMHGATRTVFEFRPEEAVPGTEPETTPKSPVAQAIIIGGRHDKLLEEIGGPRMPSAGWTMNTGAIARILKEQNANVPELGIKPKVFLIQLGEAAKRKSLLLFEDIRRAGIEIKFSLSRDSFKSQLRIASRHGVRFTLIFGQKEAIEGTVILREMETGIQETIPLEKIIEELKKRLKR